MSCMKKRVLFILGRYYPKASPNSICTQNIIELLPKDKYDIEIICYDDGLEYSGDYSVTKISRGLLMSAIYRREGDNNLLIKFLKETQKIKDALFIPVWPWTDPVFTNKVYKTALELHQKTPFDYVVSIHMPLSSVIVGNRLKKKYPSIKHVPYFLDSLSGGIPLSLFSKEWNIKKKLKWEKRILTNADKIVVMESSREHHLKYSSQLSYYSKFVFLDIPLLKKQIGAPLDNPYLEKYGKCINVTFCGSAIQPMRNISFFNTLAKHIAQIDDNIRFHFIGICNCVETISSKNIIYHGEMQHEKLIPYISNADVLLNFGVKTPSAISGKIFEYMSYLKPIISTFSIDNEACIPYLEKYPCALMIDERNENYQIQASKVVRFINNATGYTINKELITKTYINNMPETFITCVFGTDDK